MNDYTFYLHEANGRIWNWEFTCEPNYIWDHMNRAVDEYRGIANTRQLHYSLYQRKPNSAASSLVEQGINEIWGDPINQEYSYTSNHGA